MRVIMLDHELIPMTVEDRQVLGHALDEARAAVARDPRRAFLKGFLLPAVGFAGLIAAALGLSLRLGWLDQSDPAMNPVVWTLATGLLVLWGAAEFVRAGRARRAQQRRLDALETDWAAGQLAVRTIEVKAAARVNGRETSSALALLDGASQRVVLLPGGVLDQRARCAPAQVELKWCPASALTMPFELDRAPAGVPIAGPVSLDVVPSRAPVGHDLDDAPEALRQALTSCGEGDA